MKRSLTTSLPFLALALFGTLAPSLALADLGPCNAPIKATESLRSYHAVVITGPGAAGQTTMDLVRPDRFHVTQPEIEIIAIGNQAWQRIDGGAWKTAPGVDGTSVFATADSFKPQGSDATCVYAGMGLWRGQPAHIYKSASTKRASTSTLYVFGDGLIHHVDSTTSRGRVSMDFSQFNSASVSAPK